VAGQGPAVRWDARQPRSLNLEEIQDCILGDRMAAGTLCAANGCLAPGAIIAVAGTRGRVIVSDTRVRNACGHVSPLNTCSDLLHRLPSLAWSRRYERRPCLDSGQSTTAAMQLQYNMDWPPLMCALDVRSKPLGDADCIQLQRKLTGASLPVMPKLLLVPSAYLAYPVE
jgi:hypothetical protein